MGKINLTVNDDIEKQFRQAAYKVKGMKKGFLTEAIQDAMLVWLEYINQNKKEMEEKEERGLTSKELNALRHIDSGRVKMITYPNAEEFVKEMRKH
jgi:hypothetical protein